MVRCGHELLVFSARILTSQKELDAVEVDLAIDLGRPEKLAVEQDPTYYLQFAEVIRAEASQMSKHYETMYCLEQTIRGIVTTQMATAYPNEDWWKEHVPESVRNNAEFSRKREAEAGVSLRSAEPIDYITFGELSTIIVANWATFSDTFNNQKALEKVLAGLNMLRSPIAHCSMLAPDEITRLELAIKDFYRLME